MKVVLGVAGFAAFALLGAGGALLIKHLLASDPDSGTSTAHAAPMTRTQPEPKPSSAALLVVPALAASAVALPLDAPSTSPALVEPTPTATAGRGDAELTAPTRTAARTQPVVSAHIEGKPPRGVNSERSATPAQADKAACLATVNAITADLSLRNEPPSPQQLAILKRGCK